MTPAKNPFDLVTLMALLKHNVGPYLILAQIHAALDLIEAFGRKVTKAEFVPDVSVISGRIREQLVQLRSDPSISDPSINDNRLIVKQIDRVLTAIEKGDGRKLTMELKNMYMRFDDLFKGQTLYVVSPGKVAHYENPFAEWGRVPDALPSAVDAIEEAERCFALGRNTACVFHCMAVMDKGLLAFARHLRTIVNPDTDSWEAMIGGIQGAINRKRTTIGKASWKSVEAFYDEALSDLRSVKNAWRNPTMHFRRTYTEEQAEKVLGRVRDFMVHLSARVHERKRRLS